jgi:hypothetical protein
MIKIFDKVMKNGWNNYSRWFLQRNKRSSRNNKKW